MNLITDLNTFYSNVLTTSGVLLGLAFAAMTYILENGFSSFKFNRMMFLKLFTEFGKMLLYILSYLVISSFLYLSINNPEIQSVVYYIFVIVFLKSLLDYNKHRGYIYTISSNKFVPRHYGAIRAYFRSILNLGIFNTIILGVQTSIFILLPIIYSYSATHSWILNQQSLSFSSGAFLIYSVFIIARFIPQFASIARQEYESINPTENFEHEQPEVSIDYKTEKESLNQYLESHEIVLRQPVGIEKLSSHLIIYPTDNDSPEAWFNIRIDNPKGSVNTIRQIIDEQAFNLFRLLSDANADINSFVLSFHIYIDNDSRNIFFRATKIELSTIKHLTREMFLSKLKNKMYDDLFRDLQ